MVDLMFPFISVVVEIQEGKTTIVSIVELATSNSSVHGATSGSSEKRVGAQN